MDNRSSNSLIGPVVLIAVGTLLLLNTTGVLPWSVWADLWQYWPVVLIFSGISIILGGNRKANAILAAILLVLAALFVITAARPGSRRLNRSGDDRPNMFTEEFSVGAHVYNPDGLDLKVQAGADAVHIATEDGQEILTAKARYSLPRKEPSLTSRMRGCVLEAEYDVGRCVEPFGVPFVAARGEHEIAFGQPSLPTSLDMEVGSGRIDAFLEGLAVRDVEVRVGSGRLILSCPPRLPEMGAKSPTRFSFDVGSGQANISQLGNAGMSTVSGNVGSGRARIDFSGDSSLCADIEVGSGRIELAVPDEVGLSIEARIGSGSLYIDGRKYRDDDFDSGERWISENYGSAPHRIDLIVTVGSGRMEVEYDR